MKLLNFFVKILLSLSLIHMNFSIELKQIHHGHQIKKNLRKGKNIYIINKHYHINSNPSSMLSQPNYHAYSTVSSHAPYYDHYDDHHHYSDHLELAHAHEVPTHYHIDTDLHHYDHAHIEPSHYHVASHSDLHYDDHVHAHAVSTPATLITPEISKFP